MEIWLGNIDLSKTATAYEVLYTLIGLVGFAVCFILLHQAWVDHIYVRTDQEELTPQEHVAALIHTRGGIEDAVINVAIQIGIFIVGGWAMLTPPANADTPVTPLGIAASILFSAISLLLVFKSISRFRRRSKMLQALYGNDYTQGQEYWQGQEREQGIAPRQNQE